MKKIVSYLSIIIGALFLIFLSARVFNWAEINSMRYWLRVILLNNKVFFDVFVSLSLSGAGVIIGVRNFQASEKQRREDSEKKKEQQLELSIKSVPRFTGHLDNEGKYAIFSTCGEIINSFARRFVTLTVFYSDSLEPFSYNGKVHIFAMTPEYIDCDNSQYNPTTKSFSFSPSDLTRVAEFAAKNRGSIQEQVSDAISAYGLQMVLCISYVFCIDSSYWDGAIEKREKCYYESRLAMQGFFGDWGVSESLQQSQLSQIPSIQEDCTGIVFADVNSLASQIAECLLKSVSENASSEEDVDE